MSDQSVFTTDIINEGRVFAENGQAFAFPTNMPITPGHSLVAPKRVVATISQLSSEELVDLFEMVETVKKLLQQVFGAEGFNYAWNEGSEYGQSVPHLHLHIVPRTAGDAGVIDYEPRQFLYRPGSRAESPIEEIRQVAQLLKKANHA